MLRNYVRKGLAELIVHQFLKRKCQGVEEITQFSAVSIRFRHSLRLVEEY